MKPKKKAKILYLVPLIKKRRKEALKRMYRALRWMNS